MPSIVCVFDHFGDFEACTDQRCIEVCINHGQKVATPRVCFSDDGLRRVIKIQDCTAFSKKLGIITDPEILVELLARRIFERGDNHLAHRPRQNGTAEGHHMKGRLVSKNAADLLTNSPDVPEIEITIGLTGCAYTNE